MGIPILYRECWSEASRNRIGKSLPVFSITPLVSKRLKNQVVNDQRRRSCANWWCFQTLTKGYQGSPNWPHDTKPQYHFGTEGENRRAKRKRHEAQELNNNSYTPAMNINIMRDITGEMHVDLNACGLQCVRSCLCCWKQCSNGGKREVSRHHEMTWLRIDRYYYGNVDNPNGLPTDDVSTLHQCAMWKRLSC